MRKYRLSMAAGLVACGFVIVTFPVVSVEDNSTVTRNPAWRPTPMSSAVAAQSPQRNGESTAYGRLPLYFEPLPQPGHAFARGPGYTLLLAPNAATLRFEPAAKGSQLSMRLAGARPAAAQLESALPGVSNYLLGSDPANWRVGVRQYARARQRQVYPGIDLVHYGRGRELEYDFVVAPGADPERIRIEYQGGKALKIDTEGNLRIAVDDGAVLHRKPVVYQLLADGRQQFIDGAFRLLASTGREALQIAFDVGAYDRSRELVIDPVLSYATFLGGNNDNEQINAIAVDSAGAVYATGYTNSANFPTTSGALQTTLGGGLDVFVAKLNPAGTALEYSTYIGGSGSDEGYALRVVGGTAYVVGATTSANFPTTGSPAQGTFGGVRDVFVARLNAQGSTLLYSTYLGGSGGEPNNSLGTTDLEVDAAGNAYVAGYTDSTNFPVTAGAPQQTRGNPGGSDADAFLSKLNAAGSALLFSTYHGGSLIDTPGIDSGGLRSQVLAVDSTGNAWIVGTTQSSDMPTTVNAVDTTFNGPIGGNPAGTDAFIVRFDTVAGTRSYSSYFGSAGNDAGIAIELDSSGNAYFTGRAGAAGFPTTPGAFDTTYNGSTQDVFISKINGASSALDYSTLLGSGTIESPTALRVDATGLVFVAGEARAGFPTTAGAPDTVAGGLRDGFVTRLNANGSALLYSTFIGGSDDSSVFGLEIDTNGNAYGLMDARSPADATVTSGGSNFGGNEDAYIFKLNAAGTALLDGSYLGGSSDDLAASIAVDSQENFYVAGATESANFPVTAGAFQTTKAGAGTSADTFIVKYATTPGTPVVQPGTLQFTAANYSVGENAGNAVITVSRNGGASGAVSVQYSTSNNSAAAGSDYTAASGSLSWADGDSNPKTFTVAIVDDTAVEIAETLNLTLANPTGGATLGTPASAVLTITDNDVAAPGVSLSVNSLDFGSVNVGAVSSAQSTTLTNSGNANLVIGTVSRSGAQAAEFNVTADTCSGQTLAPNGTCALTVTFAPGAAGARGAILAIPSNASGSPTNVALSGTGVTVPLRPGTIQFSAASYSGNENGGSVTLTLTRIAGTDGAVGVTATSGGGSASAGSDYSALTSTVNWAAGDGSAKTVTVTVLDDAVDEPDETLSVTLSGVTGGATLGNPSAATVTIVDNDAPPAQTITVEGKYGGGALSGWELMGLCVLLAIGFLAQRRHHGAAAALVLLACGSLIDIPASAADHKGWHAGVAAGVARSTLNDRDIVRGLAARGHRAIVDADRERLGGHVEIGYSFANGFVLSAAFVELAKYDVTVTASAINPPQLLNDVRDTLGNAGRGARVSLGWRFEPGERWTLTPRAGVIAWRSSARVASATQTLRESRNDLDFTAGFEWAWLASERSAIVIAFDRYMTGSRNDVDTLTLGWRHRFGKP